MVPYYPQPAPMVAVAPRPKRRAQKKATIPSVNALAYRGPLRAPATNTGNETDTVQLNFAATLQSSGSGVLATVFSPGTQVTSSADWTNIANLWEEYRILSWDIEMVPWNKYYGPTTNVLPPFYSVIDRVTATALGSIADAIGYNSVMLHSASETMKRSAKMTGQDESAWTSTGSSPASAAQFYLKLYGSGFSNSINLFDYKMVYLVQVKGRK